ncbi:MAG: hypothetical protein R3D34_15845, partial [Nitratireductor sp.]
MIMRAQTDPARRCLKLGEWPLADRQAFLAGIADDDIFSSGNGKAAGWSPASVHKYRRGYGRWLNWLCHECPQCL